MASRLGVGDTSTTGTPTCRPRSTATSRACHVGEPSFCRDSSCSSNTTIAPSPETGAKAAVRVPTIEHPAAPRAQPSGCTAVVMPARRIVSAVARTAANVGTITRTWPRSAAARSTSVGAETGGSRIRLTGRSNNDATRGPTLPTEPSPSTRLGRGSSATIVGGEAAPRNVGSRPAHRHAAHWHSSTTSAGGPWPDTFVTDRSSTPGGLSTSTSTTHAATCRPCNGTRTIVPTTISSADTPIPDRLSSRSGIR